MEGVRRKKERKAKKVVNMGAKANEHHIIAVIMSILLSFHSNRELKRERNKTDFKISGKSYINIMRGLNGVE